MLSIAKRTTVGAALLLVMPLAAWISGWHWQPEEESRWLKVLLGDRNGDATPRGLSPILYFVAGFSGVFVFV